MRPVAKSDLTGRARLREAALELFAERGFEATSTRAVAAAAGLSPALVTRHFGSKQGLRAAVDAYVLDRITEQLRALDPSTDLMASLGSASAHLFGADPVLRGYLRHVLMEDSAASAELFGRLLSGARAEVDRLTTAHQGEGEGPDTEWAAFQMLCLILGPLLLERVMQPQLDEPMFAPAVLARRSAANQKLLLRGYYGHLEGEAGG
ncbi:TetR/AcrR family transcriptional regulator [Streptomyces sp. R1]|uniref:TetR/AcrR family transcriptional regulator n=1 Tax=Streptomyces TaxID=1883 RepID=UPI00052B08F4|nr:MULTISPECIES: TetR/AcrR family transcriptional regulator [unclassified Streptomyces]AIV35103.1 TetR family transcriptional regulator [Streptomyces sp. CCM_MD2014]MCC8335223.1 TetR/AcrR family transcriptional regulator [Streptomyces sp. R1]MDA4887227.1 helix-turn-helix domain containing protein [Streptomyces sp. MS2A]MYS48485.1 TetR family transcriptional regulator [Streptomyces sp. SID6013]